VSLIKSKEKSKVMSDKKEIRNLASSIEIREDGNKPPVVEGYAAVFNDETVIAGKFAERVAPGAFDQADMGNTVALFNHNIDQPLARVGRGLELSVDERGLKYRFEIGNQSYAKDLIENIRMGNVSTSSFGFTVRDDEWERRDDGVNLRTIKEVGLLFDVSPTTQGAYPTTEVGLRSMETALANQDVALIEEEEIRAEEEEEEEEAEEKAYGSEEEEEDKEEKSMDKEEEQEEEEKEEEDSDEEEERVDYLVDPAILPHPYALEGKTPEPEARNSNNSNSHTMENEKNAPAIVQSRGDNQSNVQQRYSFGKALREAASGKLSGLEAEMNQEARGEFTDAKVNVAGGISVPSFLTENRAALAVSGTDTNATAFGGTIGKLDNGFLGFLHPNDIATQMGVRAVTGVSGNVVFQVPKGPPGTSDSTNEAASYAASNMAFTAVDMGPKRLSAHVQVTEQLLAQTSDDLGAFVAAEIRKAVDAKFNDTVVASIDAAADNRAGGTIGQYAVASRNALHLEEELMEDNVDSANIRVLASPTAYRQNRQLSLDAGSGLLFASSPADRREVLGYNTVISSSVDSGHLYMMDATRAVQCRWGGLNLIIDPYTDADKGVVRIIANVYRQFACLTHTTNRAAGANAYGGYGFAGYRD
jgi:HK97 family phage prohead protease